MTTVIVDSGGANLASLQFALERIAEPTLITCDPQKILNAPRVILPGVGSALDAMTRLRTSGLTELLPSLQQPVLGICLGMQLFFSCSEEGPTECLGIIADPVRRLKPGHPVPHMGWNQLVPLRPDPLLIGITDRDYVYFVHSYAAPVSNVTIATTDYGFPIPAVIRHANFWGTQFHPERSGAIGSRILANFLRLN